MKNTAFIVVALAFVGLGVWLLMSAPSAVAPSPSSEQTTQDTAEEPAAAAGEPVENTEAATESAEDNADAEESEAPQNGVPDDTTDEPISPPSSAPAPAPAPPPAPTPPPAPPPSQPAVKTISLTGTNFAFSQKTITVNRGDTVRIVFTSEGGFHDWVVDAFGAATSQVNTGGTSEVTFTASQAGSFEYYCSVGSHRALGMVGTLIVQ